MENAFWLVVCIFIVLTIKIQFSGSIRKNTKESICCNKSDAGRENHLSYKENGAGSGGGARLAMRWRTTHE